MLANLLDMQCKHKGFGFLVCALDFGDWEDLPLWGPEYQRRWDLWATHNLWFDTHDTVNAGVVSPAGRKPPPQQEEILRPTFLSHLEQNSDAACAWVVVLLNAVIFLQCNDYSLSFSAWSLPEVLSPSVLSGMCLVTFSHDRILMCTWKGTWRYLVQSVGARKEACRAVPMQEIQVWQKHPLCYTFAYGCLCFMMRK